MSQKFALTLHTRRRRRVQIAAVGATVFAFEAAALACPICFQVEDAATTRGVRAAVLVLIGVTAAVLGGFAWFIAGFVRRAASLPLPAEQQPTGPTDTPGTPGSSVTPESPGGLKAGTHGVPPAKP